METLTRRSMLINIAFVVLVLNFGSAQGQLAAVGQSAGGIVNGLTNTLGLGRSGLGQTASNLIRTPFDAVGSLLGGPSVTTQMDATGIKLNEFTDHPISHTMAAGHGVIDGALTGLAAATNLGGVSNSINNRITQSAAANLVGGAANYGNGLIGSTAGQLIGGASLAGHAIAGAAATAGALANGRGFRAAGYGASELASGNLVGGALAAASGEQAALSGLGEQAALRGGPLNPIGAAASALGAAKALEAGSLAGAAAIATGSLAPANLASRQLLANDALGTAQAESAVAGADMLAHGVNNARSASLASNAYRQAKLATARDRVNIAGTIQNSARISDAAIATHDAATKAEDSLMGSELAVDSAATVLDSDAAYIPPVTNSLLRSLPYGRIGLRNIAPRPLTFPSNLLRDVWLNGQPVNYLNYPLQMPLYNYAGPNAVANPLLYNGHSLANGHLFNGQAFYSNNGILINGLLVNPYLASNFLNVKAYGDSLLPILANGQVEALDEVGAAHLLNLQHQAGPGATYNGYGKFNPVPMLTGSVSSANISPTSTIGTTYPIGSALVIEPRDSYFQDYLDSASARQNYDERQQ